MPVKIIRATEAFLYLPTYIAERKHVYSALGLEIDHVKNDNGDVGALKKLDTCNEPAVAVCDPAAIFHQDLNPSNYVVLCSLIGRPPFWILDKTTDVDRIDHLVYYANNLLTGNYIGERVIRAYGSREWDAVKFGEEFSMYTQRRRGAAPGATVAAVSSDLVGLALCSDIPNLGVKADSTYFDPVEAYVNVADARKKTCESFDRFITTAIVAKREAVNADMERKSADRVFPLLIQGIETSMVMLRSSLTVCEEVCKAIKGEQQLYHPVTHRSMLKTKAADPIQLDDAQIEWMARVIWEGKFYPESLLIGPEQWTTTLAERGDYYPLLDKAKLGAAANDSSTFVDYRPLEDAHRRFCNTAGVKIEHFETIAAASATERATRTLQLRYSAIIILLVSTLSAVAACCALLKDDPLRRHLAIAAVALASVSIVSLLLAPIFKRLQNQLPSTGPMHLAIVSGEVILMVLGALGIVAGNALPTIGKVACIIIASFSMNMLATSCSNAIHKRTVKQ